MRTITPMTTEHIDNVQCSKLWQSVIVTAIMDAVRPKPNTNSGLSEWRRNQREADQWIRDKHEKERAEITKHPLPPETLKKLIAYDRTHGTFHWRHRPTIFFAPTNRSAKENADRWNAAYAGRKICKSGKANLFGKQYSTAQIAWAIHHGRTPTARITHKNGDKTDARIENLRIA